MDDDLDDLKAFLTVNRITWPQIAAGKGWESELAQKYNVTGIPETILVDQEGRVYRRGLREKDLEAALLKLVHVSAATEE